MTTPLDLELVPVVLEMVEEHGVDAVFNVISGGTYSEVTRTITGGTTTNVARKVIPLYDVSLKWVDPTLIEEGDAETIVAGKDLTFTPTRGMTLTVHGEVWRIIKVRPLRTGTLTAAWQMWLRQ